jgi:DNA repair protein RadC
MATALVLCHNHPSGNIQPSDADNRLTKRLNEASKMMSICMLDHLVICDGKYFSYADQGLL